jgi:hypothetical protein
MSVFGRTTGAGRRLSQSTKHALQKAIEACVGYMQVELDVVRRKPARSADCGEPDVMQLYGRWVFLGGRVERAVAVAAFGCFVSQ